jgi:hypothetical protein
MSNVLHDTNALIATIKVMGILGHGMQAWYDL